MKPSFNTLRIEDTLNNNVQVQYWDTNLKRKDYNLRTIEIIQDNIMNKNVNLGQNIVFLPETIKIVIIYSNFFLIIRYLIGILWFLYYGIN